MMRPVLWLLFVAPLMLVTSPADAQTLWERPAGDADRVGLVVGQWEQTTEEVEEALATEFDDKAVIFLRRTPVESVSAPESMAAVLEEAERLFFFEGVPEARSYLAEQLRPWLSVTRPWMQNHEESAALFDAGLYLVRAHLELGEDEAAAAWMKRLVAAFPAHRCDERVFPPGVVELWEQAVADEGHLSAELDLSAFSDDGECSAKLNGASPQADVVRVVPNRTFLLSGNCGEDSDESARWVSGSDGEKHRVQPLHDALGEKALEQAFRRWALRWDLDAVVYVGPGDCGPTESACAAAHRRGASTLAVGLQPLEPTVIPRLKAAATDTSPVGAKYPGYEREVSSGEWSYERDSKSPSPWAIQMAIRANASRYQVSMYPKWVSAVR